MSSFWENETYADAIKKRQQSKKPATSKLAASADKVADKKGGSGKTGKYIAAAQIAQSVMGSGQSQEGGTQDTGTGMASGAVSGASAGAAFGPYGAAIGAVAGAVMGAASAGAARKAHNAKIEAQKERALGDIEERKGQQIAQALNQMGQRMRIR